jgi:AcrR family transcriptional regulator
MPRRGLDREQVLAAAVVLADEGLDRLTFARLAEQLGVRAPSLYNHVDGRAALLRLITLRGLTELADAIAADAAGLAGEDAVRATAHAYRAYARAHPGSYEATLAAPTGEDAELRAAADRLVALLLSILRAWKLEGDEAIDAIRTLRSALHGFVTLERSGGFALKRKPDASFEALISLLLRGLGSVGPRSRGS